MPWYLGGERGGFEDMKKSCCLVLLAAALITACRGSIDSKTTARPTATTAPSPLPHSMKGYELYSWQAEGQWRFTLITGTNRLKSLEEITSGADTVSADGWVRICVQGVDAVESLLRRVPEREEILWIGGRWRERAKADAGDLTLPPKETIDAIQESCRKHGLELSVSK